MCVCVCVCVTCHVSHTSRVWWVCNRRAKVVQWVCKALSVCGAWWECLWWVYNGRAMGVQGTECVWCVVGVCVVCVCGGCAMGVQ